MGGSHVLNAGPALDALPMHLVYNLMGYMKHDVAKEEEAWTNLDKACEPLDQHLASRTYFVADHITLADIIIMTQFVAIWLVVSLPLLQRACLLANFPASWQPMNASDIRCCSAWIVRIFT